MCRKEVNCQADLSMVTQKNVLGDSETSANKCHYLEANGDFWAEVL